MSHANAKWGARSLALAAIAAASASGCSSVTTPALRHETGEALQPGRLKATFRYENARLYALLPAASPAASVVQEAAIFQGGLLGISATYGVFPKLDVRLRTFYQKGGGGWSFGPKYELFRMGGLRIAGMAEYGQHAARGTVSYAGSTDDVEVTQVLSARRIVFSAPVSYHFGNEFAVYAGATFYKNSVNGTAESSTTGLAATTATVVLEDSTDLGANLGFRYSSGNFEFDLEFAMLKLNDPISGGSKMVPFYGISGGILF